MSINRRVSYGIHHRSVLFAAFPCHFKSGQERDGEQRRWCHCLSNLGTRMSLGQTDVRFVLMKEARPHPVRVQQIGRAGRKALCGSPFQGCTAQVAAIASEHPNLRCVARNAFFCPCVPAPLFAVSPIHLFFSSLLFGLFFCQTPSQTPSPSVKNKREQQRPIRE